MPEFRKDPIIDRWVIISTERGRHPSEYTCFEAKDHKDFSPFAAGNEAMTPPEIFAIRPENTKPNTAGWTLRVIPNKLPALRIEGQLHRRGEGIYDMMNGVGAHEVIIETPESDKNLSELEIPALQNVLMAFKERILDLKKDVRLKYVMIFKNNGLAAGAAIPHSHSQLIATPIIPKRVNEEINGADDYFRLKERCIYCDIVRQELKDNVRIIYEEEYFLVLAPYASRFPFETWILPKEHVSHYEMIDRKGLKHLALTLKDTLTRLNMALKTPPYHMLLHTAPIQNAPMASYHWHIEIIPKLMSVAGFEWGTGFYINSTSPEEAAQFLKEIVV